MIKALFPGTFDPPTLGHLDIISRGSKIFDNLTILIAENPNKNSFFTIDERRTLINDMITGFSNVSVDYYDGLVVKYAEHNGINILIRGVRNFTDYSYESELAIANKLISNSIETVYISAKPDLMGIKSSLVKELFGYSVDISSLVTPSVYKAMKRGQ
ncbi:MAG: pantetheine-phosphate adenylyltransferase [Spirochaetaceae bacterium 4572_7]|nr:MAG: pantetheine-phosphate adenylyltransferase [Spirochaetaceae bacterium 4572_7]